MSEVLDRLKPALADRYAIEREVGAGGMATVYLARDLRHNRKVALKVLRPELAAVLGPERFLAEIQTTANLQHPHLLPLFDSGEAQGLLFYVMPYVEGESLRARLERERQLPVDEAIRIASAVAGALDYAHRHGVVHRDLKPENILLHDGQPLVADFGIALAVSNAGGARVTQAGLSLGTPSYMSPEQAAGERDVDVRSDIYSLAAIAYEMLVGAPPHTASTTQGLIAKVLTERPQSVRAQRESVPPHVDAAIQKGLAKLPADRFGSATEFDRAVRGLLTAIGPGADGAGRETPRVGPRRRVITVGASSLLGVLASALFFSLRSAPPAGPLTRLELLLPDVSAMSAVGGSPDLFLSPDGGMLVFAGTRATGGGIFLRSMKDGAVHRIPGSEEGQPLGFSPDGEWVLMKMVSGTGLKKLPVIGGLPVPLTDSAGFFGSSWGASGGIVFSRGAELWMVSAEGGAASLVAAPETARGHVSYRLPHILPGERAALVTIWTGTGVTTSGLGVLSLDDGVVTDLGVPGTDARYLDGHVIFAREDGSVFSAPFSVRRLELTDEPTRILEGVNVDTYGSMELAASTNGTIVYRPRVELSTSGSLVFVDRTGSARQLPGEQRAFWQPRVSPDGRRVAMAIGPPWDVWTFEIASGIATPVTNDGDSQRPEWTHDGRALTYVSGQNSLVDVEIRSQRSDGGGVAEVLFRGDATELSYSPRGDVAVLRRGGPRTGDIWLGPADDLQSARPFIATGVDEFYPRISPDGRLLAYVNTKSGDREVFVRSMDGTGQIQVSAAGGHEPVWSAETGELFYRTLQEPRFVIAATLSTSPELSVVRRDSLFQDEYFMVPGALRANYDVLPSGRGFIMVQRSGEIDSPLVVIVNGMDLLKARNAKR